jgi:hypothetical protein
MHNNYWLTVTKIQNCIQTKEAKAEMSALSIFEKAKPLDQF